MEKLDKKNGIKIIECDYMELDKVHLIYVKKLEDFAFLAGKKTVVYKLNNSYYLFSNDTVWVYEDKK